MQKRFRSLVEAVSSAVGFMSIEGYEARHVTPDNAEREVRGSKEQLRKVSSCRPTVGVNSVFDGLFMRFPFDSGTYDVSKDWNHHTTCDIGSILDGTLRKGYSLVMVGRNEKGQFERQDIEFDFLCPQLPEGMVKNYLAERHTFELANDEQTKAIKQAKDRGLMEKRPYIPSDGSVKYRVDNIRQTWTLAELPKNKRFAWAKDYPKTEEGNKKLMNRIADLEVLCVWLAKSWRIVCGLEKIKGVAEVFRIIDAGLVESGRVAANIGEKNDPKYVTPEQYQRMLEKGEIRTVEQLEDGRLVGCCE